MLELETCMGEAEERKRKREREIYIYRYIYRERDREKKKNKDWGKEKRNMKSTIGFPLTTVRKTDKAFAKTS